MKYSIAIKRKLSKKTNKYYVALFIDDVLVSFDRITIMEIAQRTWSEINKLLLDNNDVVILKN